MKPNQWFLFFSTMFLSVLILQFNNCASGVQEEGDGGNGITFGSESPALELNITNKSLQQFRSPGLDIGGSCNTGGLDNVSIRWELRNRNGKVVDNQSSSLLSSSACIDGVYSLQVLTHNPSTGTRLGNAVLEDCIHTLSATIYGNNAEGELVAGSSASVQLLYNANPENDTCN